MIRPRFAVKGEAKNKRTGVEMCTLSSKVFCKAFAPFRNPLKTSTYLIGSLHGHPECKVRVLKGFQQFYPDRNLSSLGSAPVGSARLSK
jgi:hypothetical protein